MSATFSKTVKLTCIVALAAAVSACGVRGSLVPPEGRDVLIETSDSKTTSAEGDRFPAPEPVEEN